MLRRTFLHLSAGAALLTGLAFPALADGIPGAPAPFDKGGVKLALIVYLSGGDYYQNYEAGVKRQADALGIELRSFQGRQKPDEQREQAGGKGEAIADVVGEALDAGIKVAVQNVELPQKDIIVIDQDESKQLDLVLGQAVRDNGEAFKAGYIYVEGFPALDKRDKRWQAFKQSHPEVQQLAQWGAVDDTPAQTVANLSRSVMSSS